MSSSGRDSAPNPRAEAPGRTDAATLPPGMPRRYIQRTVAQHNAAAAEADNSRGDRRRGVPQGLQVPRGPAGTAGTAGRATPSSPLQHEVVPERLALRDKVDDTKRMVAELLEVGVDGERKYRLT